MQYIRFDRVTFKYPDTKEPLIKRQSFTLPTNKWIAVVGHNGSGKSTIVRLLDGLLTPQEGTISIGNLTVDEHNLEKVHRDIGMVFQNPENQFVGSTVAEDIAFGLENHNVDPRQMPAIIDDVLHQVGMAKYGSSLITDLSGGQKQRIAIAGVLAINPQIIILDEATSMLDPAGRRSILQLMKKLHSQGKYTIIMITHNLNEAELADHILAIDQGKVLANDDARLVLVNEELIEQLQLIPATGQLLKAQLRQARISVPPKYLTTEEMVEWLHQRLN